MKLYLGTDPENYQAEDLLHYPIIKTLPLKIPAHIWEDFAEYTHILLTSKNAVQIFFSSAERQIIAQK
jgi:uroporphyrinogen-III synthase